MIPNTMLTEKHNRILTGPQVWMSGHLVGLISFLLAEYLSRHSIRMHEQHVQLAVWVGFVYTPIVGIWLGWRQRSLRSMAFGAVIGIVIATLYMVACRTQELFLPITVGFPTFFGAVFAMLVGSNRSHWKKQFFVRGRKGAIAGLALGLFFSVTLNILLLFMLGFSLHSTEHYLNAACIAGSIALSLASAVFMDLISNAVGLNHIRKGNNRRKNIIARQIN